MNNSKLQQQFLFHLMTMQIAHKRVLNLANSQVKINENFVNYFLKTKTSAKNYKRVNVIKS